MNDFAPEIRRQAWWATDSRRAVKGELIDVLREKKALADPPDLSDNEAATMGKLLQPAILKLAEERIGAAVRGIDNFATCRTEAWMRAHTDGMVGDGAALVEAKNYHYTKMAQFSDDGEIVRIPAEDEVQCLHEAACFNVSRVWLAVLFGGQAFRLYGLDFSPERREDFIKTAARWWGYAHSSEWPEPATPEQAAQLYGADNGETIVANADIERYCAQLRQIKAGIDVLEGQERDLKTVIEAYMRESAVLIDIAGNTLATWKKSKDSQSFDRESFRASMPDTYNRFVVAKPGSRRFLIKDTK